ncbi:MAG: hypothetical protein NT075_12245 [Chloroflexi bacterium]|nr:hypothetical protein [Chloroflexota bacterium]
MQTIIATTPSVNPPTWVILERKLIDLLNESIYPFLEKYTREDGTLIWREGGTGSRDGADDFYESSYNWPLLYLLGGHEDLLTFGQRQWDAITRQLTAAGMVHKEYELGYDQFHQGESYIYFYFLCMADPTNPVNRERARRFAGFYLNEDPDAPNYDPEHKIIRAPHNGSGGPRWGTMDGDPSYNWGPGMRVYGLPFHDIPDIGHYDDLQDPAKARRMGEAMQERMGKGDVAGNLIVTSLIANAYLMTGDTKYQRWIVEYVDAWMARAQQNGGLLPDNVGLSGQVGETMGGKWYGGLYGWTWPHGYYNIGMAATVAATNAYLLTRNAAYLDLPRSQLDHVWALGEMRDPHTLEMSLEHHWVGKFTAEGETSETFVIPYRYGDQGWFDYMPLSPVYPTALWNLSMDAGDWERIEQLREAEKYDWRKVIAFRNKEDSGHEQPWLRFLAGDNPTYPEEILRASYGVVCRRLALIREDQADLTKVNIHHWQEHNPVLTEALVQLTLGAPQAIYNGGLLISRVRYFDAELRRPGLPADVAALIETLEAERTVLHLVNLSPFATRNVVIQAGAMGEHQFLSASYDELSSDYPGSYKSYTAAPLTTRSQTVTLDDKWLQITLPPATEIRLDLQMARFVNRPSYDLPQW